MLIALLVAQAAASEPLTMEHARCLLIATRDFEKSGESASDVATAVVNLCRGVEPRATETNVMGRMTSEDRNRTLEDIRSALRENVVRYIVQYRACENRPGCDLGGVPIVEPSRALEYLASRPE